MRIISEYKAALSHIWAIASKQKQSIHSICRDDFCALSVALNLLKRLKAFRKMVKDIEVRDENGQVLTESLPIWKKRRYLLVVLVFFGFINIYTLRINLSVGIVGMLLLPLFWSFLNLKKFQLWPKNDWSLIMETAQKYMTNTSIGTPSSRGWCWVHSFTAMHALSLLAALLLQDLGAT